jgi:hypothetical protein
MEPKAPAIEPLTPPIATLAESPVGQTLSASPQQTTMGIFHQIMQKAVEQQCPKCKQRIIKKDYELHINAHRVNHCFACPHDTLCPFSYDTEQALKKHFQQNHKDYICTKCKHICKGYIAYKRHLNQKHNKILL